MNSLYSIIKGIYNFHQCVLLEIIRTIIYITEYLYSNILHFILRFSKVFKGGENKGENAELQLAKELKVFHGKDKNIKGQCEIKACN